MSTSESKYGLKQFEKIRVIGKGGFGTVYLVKGLSRSYKNREFAMKEISNEKASEERIRLEIDALRVLNEKEDRGNNQIVKFYESFVENSYTYIIMEYCKEGSLREHIKKYGPMDVCKAADIVSQLVMGIGLIHQCKIAHRDLTAANVLIASKRDGGFFNVKIADFGLTKQMPKRPSYQTCVGTPGYMAPEVLERGVYDESADVYSLGAILYMMLTASDPLRNLPYDDSGRTPLFGSDRFDALDEDAKDLISKLMCKSEHRLLLPEIQSQPFIRRALVKDGHRRGLVPRSSSAEQRGIGALRRISSDGGGDIVSDRMSNDIRPVHQPLVQRLPLPSQPVPVKQPIQHHFQKDSLLPSSFNNQPRQFYRRTAGASNDSAFCSDERQRCRSNSQCTHKGVSVGHLCSCGSRVDRALSLQQILEQYRHNDEIVRRSHYHQTPTNNEPQRKNIAVAGYVGGRRTSSEENRLPINGALLPNSRMVRGVSLKASTDSMPTTASGNINNTIYDWPIPYTACFARASAGGYYRRLNTHGRIFVSDGEPNIVYEMYGKDKCVELIFRLYWSYTFGKSQLLQVFEPSHRGIVINEDTDQMVERNRDVPKKQICSLSELSRQSSAVQAGYGKILSFIKLMRFRFWRRRIRNFCQNYSAELRYDGTIILLQEDRELLKLRVGQKIESLECQLDNQMWMAFELCCRELRDYHQLITEYENNLPNDVAKKLLILEKINTPTEVNTVVTRNRVNK